MIRNETIISEYSPVYKTLHQMWATLLPIWCNASSYTGKSSDMWATTNDWSNLVLPLSIPFYTEILCKRPKSDHMPIMVKLELPHIPVVYPEIEIDKTQIKYKWSEEKLPKYLCK